MDVHWTSTQATKESQFRFFLELTKKYQVSILPTSETVFFWNISFDVFTSDLAPSRMIFGKRWPFLVTKSSTFKEAKRLYFFVTLEFFVSITFATELVHKKQKKQLRRQLIVAFEKQTLKWQWKEDKIICGKANSYFRRLSGPFRKNEEISKVVYFFSFGLKLKMKLVETVSVTIGVKFRQTSYASKTN